MLRRDSLGSLDEDRGADQEVHLDWRGTYTANIFTFYVHVCTEHDSWVT